MEISVNVVLDGYRLIREIGRGGFGVVWLCQNESLGGFHALKWISASSSLQLEYELKGLESYRQKIGRTESQYLLPIEHIRLIDEGLFYVTPLADGPLDRLPTDSNWLPFTLATLIDQQRKKATWFSSSEIRSYMEQLLLGVDCLSVAGLVHRDIKPENIILHRGVIRLSDYGLVVIDAPLISRKGSPVYLAPSWYLESSGNPDMWACACVLYTLLTGNQPDKMGRTAFFWPPSGESSLSKGERSEWIRLHHLIHRATAEHQEDRFLDFKRFAMAILGHRRCNSDQTTIWNGRTWLVASGCLICCAFGFYVVWNFSTIPDGSSSLASRYVGTNSSQESHESNTNTLISEYPIGTENKNLNAPSSPPIATVDAAFKLPSVSGIHIGNSLYFEFETAGTIKNRTEYPAVERGYPGASGNAVLLLSGNDGGSSAGFKIEGLEGEFEAFLCAGNAPDSPSYTVTIGKRIFSLPDGSSYQEKNNYREHPLGRVLLHEGDIVTVVVNGTQLFPGGAWIGLDYLRFERVANAK